MLERRRIISEGFPPRWKSRARTRNGKGRRFRALTERGWAEHECRHGLYYVPPGLEPLAAWLDDGWRGYDLVIANGLSWATVALLDESEFRELLG